MHSPRSQRLGEGGSADPERTTLPVAYNKAMGRKPLDPATEKRIIALLVKGDGFASIADTMTTEGYETSQGGQWRPSSIQAIARRLVAEGKLKAVRRRPSDIRWSGDSMSTRYKRP
jgi:hypothetical protein